MIGGECTLLCMSVERLSDPSIADNPESDIAGANNAGWSSVLVKTGVYDRAQGLPKHKPTHIADNVELAVQWALQRELRWASS
jgi:ribonucleotide monophosphatase NagD (HAD superfamily)